MRQWMLQFWKFLHNISQVLRRLELGESCNSAFFPHSTRPKKKTKKMNKTLIIISLYECCQYVFHNQSGISLNKSCICVTMSVIKIILFSEGTVTNPAF